MRRTKNKRLTVKWARICLNSIMRATWGAYWNGDPLSPAWCITYHSKTWLKQKQVVIFSWLCELPSPFCCLRWAWYRCWDIRRSKVASFTWPSLLAASAFGASGEGSQWSLWASPHRATRDPYNWQLGSKEHCQVTAPVGKHFSSLCLLHPPKPIKGQAHSQCERTRQGQEDHYHRGAPFPHCRLTA